MHTAIVKNFKKYHLFGFTGTPIFSVNSGRAKNPEFFTTGQTFGDQLHSYTIVDAINDKNVLPFRVDYIKTMDTDEEITDEMVWDINREKVMMAPERIRIVTQYILEHFDQKTYRGDKTYIYNTLTNIEVMVQMRKKRTVFWMKKIQRTHLLLTNRPENFLKKPSRIIMKYSIRTTILPAINSRIIIKMYRFG